MAGKRGVAATVVLADGTAFHGTSFGAPPRSLDELERAIADDDSHPLLRHAGEILFNTAMSGYPEVLTDPSYTGQIVAMTYPHIGNYGVADEWSERGPYAAGGEAVTAPTGEARAQGSSDDERARHLVSVAGMVVRSLYRGPVPTGRVSLSDYLATHGVPGVTGVDTRALTVHLRNHGIQNALIVAGESRDADVTRAAAIASAFPAMEGRGLLAAVGTRAPVTMEAPKGAPAGPHVALYDCGAKANIIRELHALGCRLSILPSTATAEEIRSTRADAMMLSNGPGDPAVLAHQVAQARELIGAMPLLGICLGHQILAEAAGGTTFKMKFGHHGINHPVRDEFGHRVFVTSQNHGFAVREEDLPDGMAVWFRNANDGSIEGLRDDARHIRTTQFHPESAPGPTDSRWIFSAFLEAIPGYQRTEVQ